MTKREIQNKIKKFDALEFEIKKVKHENGYCAENVHCMNKSEKGRWCCSDCTVAKR